MRKGVVQLYTKNNEVLFSLAWNIISDNLEVLVLKFLEIKSRVFLSQKFDGNMIITDYWKDLVLNFSEMGNTVFSSAKKLTEICLLITGKFLFWTFRWLEIRSFFESRSWWKDDIYWLLRSSCFELFGDGKYGLFFSQKVDGKMIFTWSFWAFYDIPGPGKYGFSHCGWWTILHRWWRGYLVFIYGISYKRGETLYKGSLIHFYMRNAYPRLAY